MSEARTDPEPQKLPVIAEVEKAYGTLEPEHAKLLSARPDLAKDLLLARKTIDEVMTSGATVLLKLWQALAVVGFELTIIVEMSIIDGVVKARELDAKWRQILNLFVGIPYNLFAVHQLHPEPKHQPKEPNQMSQPITEQVAAEAITKFIAGSELIPDDMKQLFIGRVTNWETPAPSQDAPSNSAPCPLSIVQEANRTFAVVIGDRKWPIANCGTIGHTIAEGEEFHNALLPLGSVSHLGFPAPFRIPTDDEIRKAKNTAGKNVERLMRLVEEYEKAITLRRGVGKTLGQVAYEAFHSAHKPTGWRVNPWDEMDVFEKNKWEIAGESCFLSIGTSPDEVAQDIQTIAARERFILLSEKYVYTDLARKQERATFINSVAGFPRAPETT